MKKIIFFDVDNTILESKTGRIPSQTLKLLDELSKRDNVYLGIATGRGPSRLEDIDYILHYFDAFVYSNGAYATFQGDIVYAHPFSKKDLEYIIEVGLENDLLIGVSAANEDKLIHVPKGDIPDINNPATVDPLYYLTNDIYQIWLTSNYCEYVENAAKRLTQFDLFHWINCGLDIAINNHTKGSGIEKIKQKLLPIQVISVGDGHNDISMIEVADIGIAMGNTRFDDLKEKADLISPHISEDKLYDFFKEHKII